MCGICGVLQFKDSSFQVTPELVNSMRDTMIHRGPDGGDTWVSADRKVGLGHRRLSIIDLSDAASQPMSNEDQTVWLTYNGEIYNHGEIRQELEILSNEGRIPAIKWKTDHSDTEAVLRAYEVWGIDCIQKFRGMFAFAIWDSKSKNLWLVRDRIGIKPLYYSIHHGRITFASEIKALLEDSQVKRALNEEAFYHYLSFMTTPAPDSLFEGIKKLPGGHWLRVDSNGEVEERRYWDVWDHAPDLSDKSEDQIAEMILDELRTSVRLRKVSDVPVGVFLSGGIDSSTNAALFSEGGGQRVKTFSIGYDTDYGTYKNELHYAERMAKEVNAEHFELRLKVDDLLEFLPQMAHLQDEPIADPVCVPVYFVSKLARDNGVIVCQVGEGSDELFWGYDSWKIKLRLQECNDWPVPGFLKRLGVKGLEMAGKEETLYYEFLRRGASGLPVFWGGAEAFTEGQKRSLISPRLQKKFSGITSWDALAPIRRRFEEKAREKSHLNWMSYVDLNFRLPELLLMRVDKMSMGVSLEGRVPFLDHKFVELAMGIPTAIKTKDGIKKYILKKAVKGIIPDELIHRPKQGFGVPVYEWFMDKLGEQAITEIKSFCEKTDYISWNYVEKLVENKSGPSIWYLLNFALWHRQYIED